MQGDLSSSQVLPSSVQVLEISEGMQYLKISAAKAEARIFHQGAHIANFQPAGTAEPVLFLSAESVFRKGTPIRGGVPVIFPWFGPHPEKAELPAHGLVRTKRWELEEAAESASGVVKTVWSISDDEESRALWPHPFRLRLTVEAAESLHMTLDVENTSSESFTFEEALHTYLTVSDARTIRVRGLHGVEYLDKTAAMERKTERDENIRITSETDRIYLDTEATCYIDDPGFARTLEVSKNGSETTVLWNPWIGKSAALPDFGDDEWQRMVCIETTNAAGNAITLAPGATHRMTATVRVLPLHQP